MICPSKSFVPITRRIVTNVLKYTLNTRCSDEGKTLLSKCTKVLKSGKDLLVYNKCKEYKEALAQCPKPSHARLCCRKLFRKPEPKCESKVAADEYQRAYDVVTARAKSIVQHLTDESQKITGEFERELRFWRDNQMSKHNELSRNLYEKLEELMALDAALGSQKRKNVLLVNDRARQAFITLQYEIAPSMKVVKSALDKLKCDASISVGRVKLLILSCRKCGTPQDLSKCAEQNADRAVEMLAETTEEIRVKLDEIRNIRDEIVNSHKASTEEIMEAYRAETEVLSNHLQKCIFVIKRLGN
ncbi:hypothetical protein KM043_007122 [Ampulex compressa]|nr:hypothetical protein KM043_007122 [Ampulex compressa]